MVIVRPKTKPFQMAFLKGYLYSWNRSWDPGMILQAVLTLGLPRKVDYSTIEVIDAGCLGQKMDRLRVTRLV